MDNNTPNYAKWIPEAGGYVHNGTVVSTNPIYDAQGRQEVDVDVSRLTPQTSVQTVVTNPEASGFSIGTQANQSGSGEDVNQVLTQANSLTSLSENTANTGYGPLNSPVTSSPSAGEPILTPLEQIDKDIAYMVATNNYKGVIDGYIKRQQITGEDNSQIINYYTNLRNEKIKKQDDAYSREIANATATGDDKTAAELQQQQAEYRNKVGYQDAIRQEYQTKQQDLYYNDYIPTYLQGVMDIANAVLQQVGGLANFQYNPQNDMALQVAQGYAVGAVKEQMNHTGMYYSTMTQSAITRAVAELVPVYEKMAKDEIKENISMLQNTANFLMNLEQTQFNLWRDQLQLKWEANNEKRKEYQAALDRTNAWGYVSNNDAAILGVAPGTLSPEAMAEARALQQQIDKENRSLQNDMELARYKAALELEYMKEKAYIDEVYKEQYLRAQYGLYGSGSGGSGSKSGAKYVDSNGNEVKYGDLSSVNDVAKSLAALVKKGASDEELLNMARRLAKNESVAYAAYLQSKGQVDEAKAKLTNLSEFATNAITDYTLAEKLNTFLEDGTEDVTDFLTTIKKGDYSSDDMKVLRQELADKMVGTKIDSYANEFGSNYGKTFDATKKATEEIIKYAQEVENAGLSPIDDAELLVNRLFKKIDSTADYDHVWTDFSLAHPFSDNNNPVESKKAGKEAVVSYLKNSGNEVLATKVAEDVMLNNDKKYSYDETTGQMEEVKDTYSGTKKNLEDAAKAKVESTLGKKGRNNI